MTVDTAALVALANDLEANKEIAPAVARFLRSAADELDELRKGRAKDYERLQEIIRDERAAHEATKRELEKLARETGVHSVGTCIRCGYYGPGPYHDCAAALHAQLTDLRARLESAEGALQDAADILLQAAANAANHTSAIPKDALAFGLLSETHGRILDHFARFKPGGRT